LKILFIDYSVLIVSDDSVLIILCE